MGIFNTGPGALRSEADERAALEEIRAMMAALARTCEGPAAARLELRIRIGTDAQSLWFMRSELMAMLAKAQGEHAARAQLATLGEMFDGLLPPALHSRPSPLSAAPGSKYDEPPES